MNQAACALVYCKNTKRIIAVSRRDSDKLSLPGGKLDPDETLKECVIREVKEEAGITLDINKSIDSYSQIDSENYLVETFIFITDKEYPFIQPYEEVMKPQWIGIEEFRQKTIYLEYNDKVLDILYTYIG